MLCNYEEEDSNGELVSKCFEYLDNFNLEGFKI